MLKNKKCFCGSEHSFNNCCQVFIEQKAIKSIFPQRPEELMRSRFSAYAIGNSQYIYDTYAKQSQALQSVKEINDGGEFCLWIALIIHASNANGITIDLAKNEGIEQFVEFSAFYITNSTLCELRENSRFIVENSQWRYIDGDIIEHSEIMQIKQKDLCPCNNYPTAWSIKKGKKFKQCCGKE
jgi:SEC-C motif-containing protein